MSGKRTVEARRWFQQATYDLKAAQWNIEGEFYDTACFLAQQAGEKALKSLLYERPQSSLRIGRLPSRNGEGYWMGASILTELGSLAKARPSVLPLKKFAVW